MLLQRYGTKSCTKIKQTPVPIHAQKVGHIHKVRQCRRQADNPDHGLRGLYEPLRSSNNCLNNGTTLFMKQMHLIDNEQAHRQSQIAVASRFARDHVPLFRRRNYHLRFGNFFPS